MLKKALTACALAGTITLASGCIAGPNRLTRSWDDWVNQKYTESAWVHGALLSNVVPIYPLVGFVLTYADWIVVNPWYFWSEDAWDGRGTGFEHENPTDAERTLGSAF